MGKASRLRQNSATKLSLKEFHASLVHGKSTTGIIPHVPINFSVLDEVKSEDEDVFDKDLSYEVEESPALEKVAARLERLKASCPLGITKEEQRKELQAIEDELEDICSKSNTKSGSSALALSSADSNRSASSKYSMKNKAEGTTSSNNCALVGCIPEKMGDEGTPEAMVMVADRLKMLRASSISTKLTLPEDMKTEPVTSKVAELPEMVDAASAENSSGKSPAQENQSSNKEVGPTIDFVSTPISEVRTCSSVTSCAAGQGHVGYSINPLDTKSLAADTGGKSNLNFDSIDSGGATSANPRVDEQTKSSAAVQSNNRGNSSASNSSNSSSPRHESAGTRMELRRGTLPVPISATCVSKQGDATETSQSRKFGLSPSSNLNSSGSPRDKPTGQISYSGKAKDHNSDNSNNKLGEVSVLQAEPIAIPSNRGAQGASNAKSSKLSWTNLFAAQGQFNEQISPSKLQQFNVELENNELHVPIEISKQGYAHWDYAIVGYFLDKWSSFHYVSTWARKKWADELKEVTTLDNGFYIFNLKSEEALMKILDGGPYYCGNRLILIKKWQPGMKLNKEEFSSIPIWVKFFNVPLELWTDEGLSYVASVIGKPLFLDEYTQKRSRLAFARICIEIHVEKVIPKSFNLNLGYGNPHEVKVEVPWSPKRCEGCKTFGHTTMTCPTKPKQEIKSTKQEWKVKEHKEEDDWQEVKKDKDKSSSIQKARHKEISQASSNPFDILQSYQEEECSVEEESYKPNNEEEPKQKPTNPSPLQTQNKKQLLEASSSAAKNSHTKPAKAKKK